jgi:hypothetical protein
MPRSVWREYFVDVTVSPSGDYLRRLRAASGMHGHAGSAFAPTMTVR